MPADLLEAGVGHIRRGIADPEDAVEQQLDRAGTCAHDQVGPGHGLIETHPGFHPNSLHPEDHGDREGDARDGEPHRHPAALEALEAEPNAPEPLHAATSAPSVSAR